MDVAARFQPLAEVEADVLTIGLFEGQTELPASLSGTQAGKWLGPVVESQELPTGLGELTRLFQVPGFQAEKLWILGLGKPEEFGPRQAFGAGVALTKGLRKTAPTRVALALPARAITPDLARATVEGMVVGTRGPGLRKSEPSVSSLAHVILVSDGPAEQSSEIAEAVRRGGVVGEAVNLARDLVNTPPAEKAPAAFAARARELALDAGLGVDVWDAERIRQERFGGLLGVAAGSDQPPAFVLLEYRGGTNAASLALVGKGVTFDSGGLSLKPSASMEDMKCDMTGAAVVLATLIAVAKLGLRVNLTGYLALTENMTGGRAMKLGDVLTMRNGKTVEVLNTDAEGRLILADALSYAAEAKPSAILDLATLTGACMVALGTKVAGLFASDHAFAGELLAASKRTGERAWRLPLDEDYKEGLKSQVADMKNVGGKWGGAITAAKFLQAFVGETPWLHLDIAGPSWAESDSAMRDAGGTGCFVRTLTQLVEARVV